MLEEPNIPCETIVDCLHRHYGFSATNLTFLPLGADANAAVYRAVSNDGTSYFVKLRRGSFDATGVMLCQELSQQGIKSVIPPIPSSEGPPWCTLGDYTLVVYPFVEAKNGYEISLTGQHWVEFGRAVKQVHSVSTSQAIPRETFGSELREQVRQFLTDIPERNFTSPVLLELARFIKSQRDEIVRLVERAESLADRLRIRNVDYVLCHSDLHAGNVLIDGGGELFIVDWDSPIYAPKERDLMYPGGGLGFSGHTPEEEEALFLEGYGPADIDFTAIAYYRTERVIADIAAYCEEIPYPNLSDEDREQSLRYLKSNFVSGGTIERAYAHDL